MHENFAIALRFNEISVEFIVLEHSYDWFPHENSYEYVATSHWNERYDSVFICWQ